ncbi:MAG: hypothetical protein HRF51_09775 [bacterium]
MPYISSIILSTDPSLCIYQDVKELRPFVIEIARLIRRLCDGTISSHDLNRLIQMSAYMVATRAGRLEYRLRAAVKSADCTPEEMALTLLGNIFSDKDRERYFRKSVCWATELPDAELFLVYERVIYREALQQLFHRWAEHNPVIPKLHRNYYVTLRRDKRFRRFPDDAPRWIVLSDISNLREGIPLCSRDELNNILHRIPTYKKSLGDIIEALLEEVNIIGSRSPVVSIEELFDLLAEYFKEQLEQPPPVPVVNPHHKIDANQACLAALEDVKEIIDDWVSKGMLSEPLAEVFQKALLNLTDDLVSYYDTMYYWQYLESYIKGGVSGKVYREEYRQFDTLAYHARQRFNDYFRKKYGN